MKSCPGDSVLASLRKINNSHRLSKNKTPSEGVLQNISCGRIWDTCLGGGFRDIQTHVIARPCIYMHRDFGATLILFDWS